MKGNYKLATAISFALLAGNASAAIDTGFGFATSSNGTINPGSVVFSAVNDTTKQTFVFNLALATSTGVSGLNYADFAGNKVGQAGFSTALSSALAANAGALTWNLSSIQGFSSFLGSASSLRWSVLGGYEKDQNGYTNVDKLNAEPDFHAYYADSNNTQWGALVTAPGVGSVDLNNTTPLETNPTFSGTTGKYLAAVVSKIGSADQGSIAPINGVAFYDNTDTGGISGWQGSATPGVPTKNGFGQYEFIWATNPTAQGQNQVTDLGKFTLTANTLTFSTQVSQVPVPAAIWMFGTALVGFLGISKRKHA